MRLRLVAGLAPRRPRFKFDRFSCPAPEMFGINFHLHPFGKASRVVRVGLFRGFIFPNLPLRLREPSVGVDMERRERVGNRR